MALDIHESFGIQTSLTMYTFLEIWKFQRSSVLFMTKIFSFHIYERVIKHSTSATASCYISELLNHNNYFGTKSCDASSTHRRVSDSGVMHTHPLHIPDQRLQIMHKTRGERMKYALGSCAFRAAKLSTRAVQHSTPLIIAQNRNC